MPVWRDKGEGALVAGCMEGAALWWKLCPETTIKQEHLVSLLQYHYWNVNSTTNAYSFFFLLHTHQFLTVRGIFYCFSFPL